MKIDALRLTVKEIPVKVVGLCKLETRKGKPSFGGFINGTDAMVREISLDGRNNSLCTLAVRNSEDDPRVSCKARGPVGQINSACNHPRRIYAPPQKSSK